MIVRHSFIHSFIHSHSFYCIRKLSKRIYKEIKTI